MSANSEPVRSSEEARPRRDREENPDGPPVRFVVNRRLFWLLLTTILGGASWATSHAITESSNRTAIRIHEEQINETRSRLDSVEKEMRHQLDRIENKVDRLMLRTKDREPDR